MRKRVFQNPECWTKYSKLLDEIGIWARWKDKVDHTLACRVYSMIEQHAYAPYNGLEVEFLRYFAERHTAQLVEFYLDQIDC